jgi:hypothetical protein
MSALLEDPRPAVELALAESGWRAAQFPDGRIRLAGLVPDGPPSLVTDLLVLPGSLNLETRLPLRVGPNDRGRARLLCTSLTADTGGVFSLDPDQAPVLYNRHLVFAPAAKAATTIAHDVRAHRALAVHALNLFSDLNGQATSDVLAHRPDRHGGPGRATRLDLSRLPDADPAELARAKELSPITDAEAHALARVHTQLDARTDHRTTVPTFEQLCAGPLVFHADGVVECYGCDAPTDYIHLSTVSCQPGRQLGYGETCARCAP